MDGIAAETERLPEDIDAQPAVEAALALKPKLRDYAEELEREQRFPRVLFEELREAGFYRMVVPRAFMSGPVSTAC